MARRGDAETLGLDVYQRLRRAVLDGKLPPGHRLKPAELGREFDVSVGVMREALTRLAEQRLVTSSHNQGFRVTSLSRRELADLTELRVVNEGLALRLAIERGDLAWESDVLAALHRLTRTPRRAPDNPDLMTDDWSTAHRAFHRTLLAGGGFPLLTDFCEQLSDTMELYRRWSAPASGGKRNVDEEHRRIADAALARNVPEALEALRTHYETTTAIVLASGLTPDPGAAAETDTHER
ncbi:GntR family transcriptional regulator [Pseudonocardia sp. WMMC193]|uniref:GntR family transcriptional regulator n=1 Tax=Pseudonocardia sp. WMMC193 TaxID=2911965 RepID=UPI001F42B26C|nr:FCD domain-containing protein [Pseudonocardia sp. WMMC193]MCF7547921.1 FCD domain-containing protein [Pseudonocardia sp. WMMC193]